jgi:MFS family permease
MRRVFLGGQVTSMMGDGMALLAIPLLVLQITRNPLIAGLAGAMRCAGYLAVGLPAGPVVDRLNAWRVLVAADSVRAAAFTALGVLAWLRLAQIAVLLAMAFVSACATTFFDAALAVTIQDMFPEDQLLPANSAIETANQLSRVAGPAAAGVLASTAGLQVALWIDAGTYLVSFATVGLAFHGTPAPESACRAAREMGRELAEGLRYLRAQRLIFTLTILFAITNLCLGADTLLVFFGHVTLGLTSLTVSAVIAVGGAAGVLGALSARRLDARFARIPLVAASVAVAGAGVAAMGAAASWWALALANATLIFASSQGSLLVRSIRQEIVPREMLGRVTAAVRTVFVSATPLGAALAGLGTRVAGNDPRAVFVMAGGMLIAAVALAWYTTLRHLGAYHRPLPAAAAAGITATAGRRSTSRPGPGRGRSPGLQRFRRSPRLPRSP